MRPLSRTAGLSLFIAGIGLMAWLLYDASSVRETLGLEALASEGVVVLLGLAMSAVWLCSGYVLWLIGRERDVIGDTARKAVRMDAPRAPWLIGIKKR